MFSKFYKVFFVAIFLFSKINSSFSQNQNTLESSPDQVLESEDLKKTTTTKSKKTNKKSSKNDDNYFINNDRDQDVWDEKYFNFNKHSSEYKITNKISLNLEKLNGIAYENVYNYGKKTSELSWNISNVRMLGLNFESKIDDFILLNLKFSRSIDHGTKNDQMIDYDWLGGAGYNNGDTNHNNWTRRSISAIKLQRAQNFDLNASYNLLKSNLFLKIGYRYDNFKWRDYPLSYIYSENSFRDSVGNFSESRAITYQQDFYTPYIGAEYNQEFLNKKFAIKIFGNYSNQSTARDDDNHHLRSTRFLGEFEGGVYKNFGANLSYNFYENLGINFGYEKTHYLLNKGKLIIDKYTTSNGLYTYVNSKAGIENKFEKIFVGLLYNFNIN